MSMSRKPDPSSPSLFGKAVPKMPEGYYSGDKPNPNLKKFVEQHIKERPYNPETDGYNVPAFDKPIETTKATAIYNMHTYWSKKPHDAIRQYIRHYTKPRDMVLDPFCGSGGTALAALMEDRKAIAIDRSPAATFITKNYCTPVDVVELQKAFEDLNRKARPEIDWLYETRCERCGGKASTAYTVYSQIFQCPRCMEKVPLFDCVEVEGKTGKGEAKKISTCPHCHKRGIIEEISTRAEKFGVVPVLVSYTCESGCSPARSERRHNDSNKKKREYFDKYDLGKIQEIEEKEIPYWYPKDRMMHAPEGQERWGLLWRPYLRGVERVCDLFTKRNLWALAVIKHITQSLSQPAADAALLAMTATLLPLSRMQRFTEDPRFPNKIMMGVYYLPPVSREYNVPDWYMGKLKTLLPGLRSLSTEIATCDITISTQDARALGAIKDASMDYVFTDPPYSWKVQYGEANFVWEAWLGMETPWLQDEIIVNEFRGMDEKYWADGIRASMTECYRVLKPGRWLSLCYHDSSEGTWEILQDVMAETGFIVDKAISSLFIDTKQKTLKQLTSDKITMRDLVINYRKPKPSEMSSIVSITGNEDETTFNDKVRQIIRDYIGETPGCSKDRIYDEVVSRMVRSGQMEVHDFDELLGQVAEEVKTPIKKDLFRNEDPNLFGTHEIGRWYLKETELAISDAAETAREDSAAKNLGAFIKEYLEKHPDNDGVHYSGLFEQYVYAVKDKPRRQLADILPDYFYKTEQGTWRLPASEEEERAKGEVRIKGLGRRIKRYIAQLEQGAAISDHERPNDATLAEWIRHCKRGGLFEQGKLLYEKGGLNPDNLPEEAKAHLEEDYQICARMKARQVKVELGKKRRRDKD